VDAIKNIICDVVLKSESDPVWIADFYEFYYFLRSVLYILTVVADVDQSSSEDMAKHLALKTDIMTHMNRFLTMASTVDASNIDWPDCRVTDIYRFAPSTHYYSASILESMWGIIVKPCVPFVCRHYEDMHASIIVYKSFPDAMIERIVEDIRTFIHRPNIARSGSGCEHVDVADLDKHADSDTVAYLDEHADSADCIFPSVLF
jgi:hypothetical protein